MKIKSSTPAKSLAAAMLLTACPFAAKAQHVLPYPSEPFKGIIGKTYKDSKADYPEQKKAPEGAPNVVVILLDDVGFGQPGTFGGPIPTPGMDKLASEGIVYNNFNTIGISSPTRAAILTGRNHHQMGFGTISELSTGFPGYNSVWGKDCASMAEVLKQNGYATAAWGKWHNTPDFETSPLGPFDRWPVGVGFEYFYGFHGGETSQWEPQLYRNTISVEPPKTPEQGYHLTEDLTQDAIQWIRQEKSLAPDKPYFAYFAPGAAHAPLHAPQKFIDQFKGQFDAGWDKMREYTFERQKKLGIIPKNTILTPRPEEIQAWKSLSADEKRLFAKQMEVFAGFVAHTDSCIAALVDGIRNTPGGDNTMIVYIVGDNGPSAEGSLIGTTNNMMTQNGIADSVQRQLAVIDELGGPLHENHYAVGWAWGGSTPFQWMKRVPSYFGATRNGLIISWPAHIKPDPIYRSQFHHVIDIAPTIYEAVGVHFPEEINGVKQIPIAGVSMDYTFSQAQVPSRHTTQYFEVEGQRAIYHDNWIACSFHRVPWNTLGTKDFDTDTWALYDLSKDFSEGNDLAKKYPEKVKEMVNLFDQEAKKYGVYPLDDRFGERALIPDRPSLIRGRKSFTYFPGMVRIPEGSAPPIYSVNHTITAYFNNQENQGVLVAEGGSVGGYTLYVKDGKVIYDYNFFGVHRYSVQSNNLLPKGAVEVKFQYVQTSKEWGKGGYAILFVNGKEEARENLEFNVPGRFSATETLDIGKDLGSPVSTHYHSPFAYTGVIDSIRFDMK